MSGLGGHFFQNSGFHVTCWKLSWLTATNLASHPRPLLSLPVLRTGEIDASSSRVVPANSMEQSLHYILYAVPPFRTHGLRVGRQCWQGMRLTQINEISNLNHLALLGQISTLTHHRLGRRSGEVLTRILGMIHCQG